MDMEVKGEDRRIRFRMRGRSGVKARYGRMRKWKVEKMAEGGVIEV